MSSWTIWQENTFRRVIYISSISCPKSAPAVPVDSFQRNPRKVPWPRRGFPPKTNSTLAGLDEVFGDSTRYVTSWIALAYLEGTVIKVLARNKRRGVGWNQPLLGLLRLSPIGFWASWPTFVRIGAAVFLAGPVDNSGYWK